MINSCSVSGTVQCTIHKAKFYILKALKLFLIKLVYSKINAKKLRSANMTQFLNVHVSLGMLYLKGLILFLHYLFDFSSFDEDPNLFLFPFGDFFRSANSFGDFLRSANFLGFFADSSAINQRSREVGQEYKSLAAATATENDPT